MIFEDIILRESKRKKLCTPEERLEIKDLIIKYLQEDDRIAGAIHVGSSVYDFKDKYSDLDFAIVIFENEDLMQVFNDWKKLMEEKFTVIHSFEVIITPTSLLHGFLLDNYIELDMGFQPESNIFARRKHWKIAFDKTGKLESIMQETWKKRQKKDPLAKFIDQINGTWYYITRTLIALARDNYWHALKELEHMRDMIVFVIGHRFDLKLDHYQQIVDLPIDIQRELMNLLPSKLEKEILFDKLKIATKMLYKEVALTSKEINGPDYSILEKNMLNLIDIYEKELFS